jgi:hypothetical protein
MRVLLIDQATQDRIKRAIGRAARRPIPLAVIRACAIEFPATDQPLHLRDRKPSGIKRPEAHHVFIPFGFRASFSIEEQPSGMVRHLSVSVDEGSEQRMPNPMQFAQIAEEFGFRHFDQHWNEEFAPGRWAVNVVELYQPKEEGHA